MKGSWPPLDTHAHVDPSIGRDELVALRAVVFACTRSLSEFEEAQNRNDPVTVWGVGVHPALPSAVDGFSRAEFESAIGRTPLVGEVGMDAKSPVPRSRQRDVLDAILTVLADEQRIVSVHSAGATSSILDLLEHRGASGVILHWWRGDQRETARAVELGCYFSINPSELTRPVVLGRVPWDRLLLETDHPYGDRRRKSQPGRVEQLEQAIADRTGIPAASVRRGIWGNLYRLVQLTGTSGLFGDRVRRMLSVAPPSLADTLSL